MNYFYLFFVVLSSLVGSECQFNFQSRLKLPSNYAMDDGDVNILGPKKPNQISNTKNFSRKSNATWNKKNVCS